MGLFSFLKNAGAKIFGNKEVEAAKKSASNEADVAKALKQQRINLLTSIVESLNMEIEDFSVDLEQGTVTLYGQIDTQANKERVILAVGNVNGIASVDDRMTVLNVEPEAIFYTVQSGDSLSKIAKSQYGNAMKYPVIFEANKPMLSHPDKIYPGQVLRIPAL